MHTINLESLRRREEKIRAEFASKRPFRYAVIENFLKPDAAADIYSEFPEVDTSTWVDASGLHTRRKWTQPVVKGSSAEAFYSEINSEVFRRWMSEVVGIDSLLADSDLQGAGLHQTLEGGYLDVHVDFNKHSTLQLDRRLNLIVYLCKHYDPNGEGFLELWDMSANTMLRRVAPAFNRCVIFETNEISFHGHPKPWKNSAGESRKSLSVYYYTSGRDDVVDAPQHSTIYVNTEGRAGKLKTVASAVRDIARLGPIRRRLPGRKSKN